MRRYPRDRIYFLPRDPHWSFLWWEVTAETVAQAKAKAGGEWCNFTIRINDVTDIIFDGDNAHSFFDIDVYVDTDNWFHRLPLANRNYVAVAGFKTAGGAFYPAIWSNTVYVPSDRASDFSTTQWSSLEI